MAKCPGCGIKLIRDVIKKGSKGRMYKNYRCPKCGKEF